MLFAFVVGTLAAALGRPDSTDSTLPLVQLAAGAFGAALALTRAHQLWPMALTFAVALLILGVHRLELTMNPAPAHALVVQPAKTVAQSPTARR